MLIKCVECGLDISDKAYSCPHCGYPIRPEKIRVSRSNKRKRLPNGFGQISEIRGKNLRKPFRAMVSVGKSANGRPICKLLKPVAYFSTYNEAYEALLAFNKSPYDVEKTITMWNLYELWTKEHFDLITSESRRRSIRCAWDHCEPIYNIPVRDAKVRVLKEFILSVDTSNGNKVTIKQILNIMFDYAIECEIVDRNYAREFKISRSDPSKMVEDAHKTFTSKELKALWEHAETSKYHKMVLIQCYTGFRPQELCTLKTADVDVEGHKIVGGMKTAAGMNRTVPINSLILNLVKEEYDRATAEKSEFLFGPIAYRAYHTKFTSVINGLGLDTTHKPHDCRVTFVTLAKEYGLDEYALKRIVGHAISDLTERVYTKRGFDWLLSEMNKITGVGTV